ncbi:MAG: carbon-nitrogen hydrolase family protein [Acidaminobacteraceae bacterium]
MNKINILAMQMDVTFDKESNLSKVRTFMNLQTKIVDIVVLPEMFICPYDTGVFSDYAEEQGGYIWSELSCIAKEYSIYLVAGSVPEKIENHIYNTSYVFDRNGEEIAKHRKMHLFDIDIEGGQYFKESDILSAGDNVSVFDTEFGRIGLCICYDIRFPELSRIMVDMGAKMIIIPAAFNMTTGPDHWDILFRTRAVDNQVFMLGVSAARNTSSSYTAWGHSILVSPFGKIINQLNEDEGLLYETIDFDEVDKVRKELPLLQHRRKDLYTLSLSR